MKFTVNDNCIACGLCTGICPDVFTLEGDIAHASTKDVQGGMEAKAREAMQSCPVDAIEER